MFLVKYVYKERVTDDKGNGSVRCKVKDDMQFIKKQLNYLQ